MGEGVIPLHEMLSVLKEKGYEGALSVEIFRDAYWQQDPGSVSIAAKGALDRTVATL
jgi:2-keto-myo-inositol isomerase